MSNANVKHSGTFKIGGNLEVNRLGYGAMRITGRGIWGEPVNRVGALETLRRLPELGVNFIDTANSYGPDISEQLIREALYPYDGLVIATKAGLVRTGPDAWHPLGRPEYLIQEAYRSAWKLGVEQIDLWQLHRIDPRVPRDEQFDAIHQLQSAGLIRHAGLSEVTIEEIEAAREVFPVATVQNRFNLADRGSEDVLDYCEANGIGFIPWYPLAAGQLTKPGSILSQLANRKGVSASQIALAWTLKRSPVILPIPGTSQVSHLEENVAATGVELTDDEFSQLDEAGRQG